MDVNLDGNTITNAYFEGVIEALPNLTANGFVKTTDGDGTLSVETAIEVSDIDATGTPSSSTYLRGDGTWSTPSSGGTPVTLTGDAVGTGTGTVPVTVEGLNGTSLAGLASGILYNTTATGVPSIATANELALGLSGTTGTVNLSGATVMLPADCVSVPNINATGTPSPATFLRGDGTWSSAGGGTITLTGDATGSGTSSIPVTVGKINGTSLAGLSSGLLYNTTSTGAPSIATANQVAAGLTGTSGTIDLSNATLKIPQGTAATLAGLTPASGEPYWTTDTKELFLGDGSTVGANRVVKVNSKNIYVSQSTGNDTRAAGLSKYDPNIPFATLTAAAAAAASGDTVVALDGTFIDKNIALANNVNWIFYPSATISTTATTASDAIFVNNTGSGISYTITGFGQTFSISCSSLIATGTYFFCVHDSGTGAGTCSLVNINWSSINTATSGYAVAAAIFLSGGANYTIIGNISASCPNSTTTVSEAFTEGGTGLYNIYGDVTSTGAYYALTGYAVCPKGQNYGTYDSCCIYGNIVGQVYCLTPPSYRTLNIYGNITALSSTQPNCLVNPGPTNVYGNLRAYGACITGSNASYPVCVNSIVDGTTSSSTLGVTVFAGYNITTVTGTSQTAGTNQSYIANNASLVTVTLPSAANVGDTVEINGLGAGGWLLAQNASQVMHMSSASTTTGTGGSIASTNQYNTIKVRCIVASTTWIVIQSQGTLTIT